MSDQIHAGDKVRYRDIAFCRQIPGTVTWVAERPLSFAEMDAAPDYTHDVRVLWNGSRESREWSGNLMKVEVP